MKLKLDSSISKEDSDAFVKEVKQKNEKFAKLE
jgi:hypothetical protein